MKSLKTFLSVSQGSIDLVIYFAGGDLGRAYGRKDAPLRASSSHLQLPGHDHPHLPWRPFVRQARVGSNGCLGSFITNLITIYISFSPFPGLSQSVQVFGMGSYWSGKDSSLIHVHHQFINSFINIKNACATMYHFIII